MSSPAPPPSLRRALLDAALERIAREGPLLFTMSDLARATGVSSGAPYRHFKDKTQLLTALALEGLELAEAVAEEERRRAGAGPLEQFRALGVATVIFAVRHPAHAQVLWAPELLDLASHSRLQALLGTHDEATEALMAQARERGEVDPGHPMAALLTAQATMYGLARLFVDGRLTPRGEDEARTLAEQVTAVLGMGLLPRA
jgi:AcrR family transcriptional regulator